MSVGQARDLLDDLLRSSSREENRHFEDGVDVTLKSRESTVQRGVRMLKVWGKMKMGTGICREDVAQGVRDLGSRTAWNGGYGAQFGRIYGELCEYGNKFPQDTGFNFFTDPL